MYYLLKPIFKIRIKQLEGSKKDGKKFIPNKTSKLKLLTLLKY